ncbi:MAG: preprotein translocase subunit SecE [Deltaproteobacteria bacterium]|nr:MAG: preprotein translocase subunit SecE [Deltaproteobacteria bacterium]
MNKAGEFLGQVRAELEKVTWPTRKETYGTTIVVIVLVLLVCVYLWVVDTALSTLIRSLLK